jgi:N utilization substance protein B
MSARQQPRRTARELALLGLSQVSGNDEKLAQQDLNHLMLAAVRTLVSDVRETLETAGMEVRRGSDRLNKSEVRAPDVHSARVMVREGLTLAEQAINRLGAALDLPEFINLANQKVVRDYAFELVGTIKRRRAEISAELERSLVDWSLSRLPQLDRQILMIAVAEIRYLNVPDQVAINEAVELAKRYSDEEGARFINGVLRRVTSRKYSINREQSIPSESLFAPVEDPEPPQDVIPPPAPEPEITPTPPPAPEAIAPPPAFSSPEVKPIRTPPRAVPEAPPEAIAPPSSDKKPSQEILRVDPRPPSTAKPIQKPVLKSTPKPKRTSTPNAFPAKPYSPAPTPASESAPAVADGLDLDELSVSEAIAEQPEIIEPSGMERLTEPPEGVELGVSEAIAAQFEQFEPSEPVAREAIADESVLDELTISESDELEVDEPDELDLDELDQDDAIADEPEMSESDEPDLDEPDQDDAIAEQPEVSESSVIESDAIADEPDLDELDQDEAIAASDETAPALDPEPAREFPLHSEPFPDSPPSL